MRSSFSQLVPARCASRSCFAVTLMTGSTQQETISEWIVRSDQELVTTGDVGAAADFWNHGLVRAEGRRLDHPAPEARADDALDLDDLIQADFSARVVQGESAGYTRPGRGTVDLALGEHAHVTAVNARVPAGRYEDGPVEESQVRLERMRDRVTRRHGALDLHPGLDEPPRFLRNAQEAEGSGRHVRVEGAAEREIESHRSQTWNLDLLVQREHERRHVSEPYLAHAPILDSRERSDRTRRRVDAA